MPAKNERQRRLAGADLARKRAGKPTVTGMSATQLRDFATKPVKPPAPRKRGRSR